MDRKHPIDRRRSGDAGPDLDRYQCYEEEGQIVIRDSENDGAWIRSSLAYDLAE